MCESAGIHKGEVDGFVIAVLMKSIDVQQTQAARQEELAETKGFTRFDRDAQPQSPSRCDGIDARCLSTLNMGND